MKIKLPTKYKEVKQVLEDFCDEFIALLKEKLEAHGHNVTGTLLDSLKMKQDTFDDEFILSLESEDYLYWLDNGRQPDQKWPPKEKIEDWVKAKHIADRAYPDKNGKLPTEKQLVYLISRSIGERGTLEQYNYGGNGGKYTEECVRELYPRYKERFEWALYLDFMDYSKVILDEINTMIKI